MSTQLVSRQPAPGIPALTLGWRLQMALRHGGVSVQEMADELGMARNSLSRWLGDRAVPRAIFLKAWALRTGVPYQWLATGETGDDPGGSGELPRLDSNQQPSD